MERIPLDFIQRVVNLLSYDDYHTTHGRCFKHWDGYHKVSTRDIGNLYEADGIRESHASAFSRLPQPWPRLATSLKECRVYVFQDVYSIHEMVFEEEPTTIRRTRILSEVDLLTWNSRTHVVRELCFGERRPGSGQSYFTEEIKPSKVICNLRSQWNQIEAIYGQQLVGIKGGGGGATDDLVAIVSRMVKKGDSHFEN
uniref:F-box domain-containing protein n=1 Tax=Steinernema glaseri TaxID=37863 RepID=A0A1I7Z1T6_9BILA